MKGFGQRICLSACDHCTWRRRRTITIKNNNNGSSYTKRIGTTAKTLVMVVVVVVVAFSSLAGILWEGLTIHSPPAFYYYYFLEWRWLAHKIPFFRPGSVHSGSASWDDWRVACELVSWEVPTLCLDSGIVSSLRLRWVKGVCGFRCNLPPALIQNDRGLLRATAVTRGGTDTESAHKVNSGEENYRDLNSQPFDRESGAERTSYPGSSQKDYNH